MTMQPGGADEDVVTQLYWAWVDREDYYLGVFAMTTRVGTGQVRPFGSRHNPDEAQVRMLKEAKAEAQQAFERWVLERERQTR